MSDNFLLKSDVFDKPNKVAELLFEALEEEFAKMTEEEFEGWMGGEIKKQYIRLGEQKIAVSIQYKKALLHYVAFLYYWKTPKR